MNVARCSLSRARSSKCRLVRAGASCNWEKQRSPLWLAKIPKVRPFVRSFVCSSPSRLVPSHSVSRRFVSPAREEKAHINARVLIHARHFARGVYFKAGPGSKIPPLPERPIRSTLSFSPVSFDSLSLSLFLSLRIAPRRRRDLRFPQTLALFVSRRGFTFTSSSVHLSHSPPCTSCLSPLRARVSLLRTRK